MAKKDLTCFTTKEKVVVCKDASSKEGKAIAAKKKGSKLKIIAVEPPKVKTPRAKPKLKIVEAPKVKTPRPKTSDKVKKFIEGGQQKGNRLDNLPDDLKYKIMGPKLSDKVKKFIEGGRQKGSRLDNLPDDLKDIIMKKKTKLDDDEERDFPKIDQQARTLPLIKNRIDRLIDQTLDNPKWENGFHQAEEDVHDDHRMLQGGSKTNKRGEDMYKFSEWMHEEAEGIMRLPKKWLDTHEIMDKSSDYFVKRTRKRLKNLLIDDVNKAKSGKLKTNKEILDYFWDIY
tara:strand:+ start:1685 stop:2539 length:855 start_codon:yes stop_codon:yes gene_type:complete